MKKPGYPITFLSSRFSGESLGLKFAGSVLKIKILKKKYRGIEY